MLRNHNNFNFGRNLVDPGLGGSPAVSIPKFDSKLPLLALRTRVRRLANSEPQEGEEKEAFGLSFPVPMVSWHTPFPMDPPFPDNNYRPITAAVYPWTEPVNSILVVLALVEQKDTNKSNAAT